MKIRYSIKTPYTDWKEGDIVTCIKPELDVSEGSGWELGLIFRVTGVRKFGIDKEEICCFGGIQGNGVYTYALRLATKAERDKYENKL